MPSVQRMRTRATVPKGHKYGDPVPTEDGSKEHHQITSCQKYLRCVRCRIIRTKTPFCCLFEEESPNCMKCAEAEQTCFFSDPELQKLDKDWFNAVCKRLSKLEDGMAHILGVLRGDGHSREFEDTSSAFRSTALNIKEEDICVSDIDKRTVNEKLSKMEELMQSHPLFDADLLVGQIRGGIGVHMAVNLMKRVNIRLEDLDQTFFSVQLYNVRFIQGPSVVPLIPDSQLSTIARQVLFNSDHAPAGPAQPFKLSSEKNTPASNRVEFSEEHLSGDNPPFSPTPALGLSPPDHESLNNTAVRVENNEWSFHQNSNHVLEDSTETHASTANSIHPTSDGMAQEVHDSTGQSGTAKNRPNIWESLGRGRLHPRKLRY